MDRFVLLSRVALHPGAIQGKEGIKFCHLATLLQRTERRGRRRRGIVGGDDGAALVFIEIVIVDYGGDEKEDGLPNGYGRPRLRHVLHG